MFVTCDSYESDDPWIIVYMDYVPLSLVELDYWVIQLEISKFEPISSHDVELDPYSSPIWVVDHYCSCDFLDTMMSSDEVVILEAMMIFDLPWE